MKANYIVTEEVTWKNVYEIMAEDEDDARERYGADGDQVRGDIIDSTDPIIEIDETERCVCGHPMADHQTGEGPWTGFCFDTSCDCEGPSLPLHYHGDEPCGTNHGLGGPDA